MADSAVDPGHFSAGDGEADAAAAPDGGSGGKMRRLLPLILGLVLALAGGAGGYFAVTSGLLGIGPKAKAEDGAGAATDAAESADSDGIEPMYDADDARDARFVRISPLTVSLGPGAAAQFLSVSVAIETVPGAEEAVAQLEPRILDVMNGYLRALSPADIEAPGALFIIRAQLTRRLQLILGEDRMRDLLVMEFVLN